MSLKHAAVKHIGGLAFAGKADSGHWVVMDGPVELGGADGGSRPKELLLMALAGCTGSDIASILTKKRVPYTGLEIHVSGTTREEHPQVFTDIHVEYVVTGNGVEERDLQRAIELSETKYCSVSAMLRASVAMSSSYRILNIAEEVSA
jgi:putative redox protein